MSIQIYNDTSFKISKLLTNNYSTSFSLGILCFPKEYRKEIYNIYGFVRLADEIVDTFHDQNKREIFDEFKKETYNSISRQFSINPVLNSFQITVNKYNIDKEHIDAFLFSMETDLEKKTFSNNEYQNYIYGSAEVVGLMCLRIFCKNNNELYKSLENSARMLGSAFQKVNFLRDLGSDIKDRGRIYIPDIDLSGVIEEADKIKLEKNISEEFQIALFGIKQLPAEFKFGVYTAYVYYLSLFKKLRMKNIKELMSNRVRISNFKKMVLLFLSFFRVKILNNL